MKREEALDVALGQIERQFGKGSVMRMSDRPQVSIGAVSTGSLALDMALGIGGFPRGRIVEIYGPESSGKTTLRYHVIAEAQRRGGICAFIDAEHALDPCYARRSAWTSTSCSCRSPTPASRRSRSPSMLVRSGAVDMVVVDSVAALVPKAEIEGEMGDSHMGLQARLMSQALRKLTGRSTAPTDDCSSSTSCARRSASCSATPRRRPGGNALKFYASVRLDIRRIEHAEGRRTRRSATASASRS